MEIKKRIEKLEAKTKTNNQKVYVLTEVDQGVYGHYDHHNEETYTGAEVQKLRESKDNMVLVVSWA